MDNMAKKYIFFLLVCWISFKGCAGEITVQGSVTFWVEDSPASLSCRVTGSPTSVTWTAGVDVITKWNVNDGVTLYRSDGKYGMTGDGTNFVLTINNISVSDARGYSCGHAIDLTTILFNTTQVTVNDAPREPYPTIKECSNETDDHCHINVANYTYATNVTCAVTHFFPNVTITWSLRGVYIAPVEVKLHLSDDDGTYCKFVTIMASPQDDMYVCTVTGEALRDVDTMSIRAMVKGGYGYVGSTTESPDVTTKDTESGGGGGQSSSSNVGLIIGIVIACAFVCMFGLFMVYVVYVKRRDQGKDSTLEYRYSDLNKKPAGSMAEDDERIAGGHKAPRAGEPKTTTGTDDNFVLSQEVYNADEGDKKEEKKPKEDTPENNETSPDPKESGQGGDHSDHQDHSHSYSSGGGGSGGGGGDSGGGGGGGD
ncbi:uncharacterized protein LOC762799 [Strongylocentrotus purpuratus]|uniref:Ig-like domain-containing protein n=1 Tax=Strongylocentrotus purpuratus TaxID=7668 RepID=A0A7M7NEQ4_STRPU|nr:uncharacterized protein LOC762799 [Strongylocentrotus purpuratus]